MFTTENVETYLKSINVERDGEKLVAKLRLFVTPITYELAHEADPAIARMLFRANGVGYKPVLELHKADFAISRNGQGFEYRRHPEYKSHHVFVPNVELHTVSAQKLTAGDPNFSLLFTAEFEIIDDAVIADLCKLLKSKIFVTFSAMQPTLFTDPVYQFACRMCDASEPEFATTDDRFAYCARDVHQKQDGETIKRIREPKKAAADPPADPAPAQEKPAEEKPIAASDDKPGPLVDGAFINDKAAKRQRGQASAS